MDMTPLPGYRMIREIGAGSFAKVYLANTTSAPLTAVAIKSVSRSKLNKKLLENLESEISILKATRHPHIVTLMDITNTDSHIHLVMEYCPLGDLSFFIKKREKLGQEGQIPLLRDIACNYPSTPGAGLHEVLVIHFLQQLASALEFLRSENLIHRDVKPQNLLLQPPVVSTQASGVGLANLPILKLADFGFARHLQTSSMAETLCGSPLYMAPEILRYEPYDATADLWSVGTVLFEMLVGKPPFRAANHVELLRKIDLSNDAIKFPADIRFNAEIKSLIRALLRRDPKNRLSFHDFFANGVVGRSLEQKGSTVDAQSAMENSMLIRPHTKARVTSPIIVPVASRASENKPSAVFNSPAYITDLIPVNTPPAQLEQPSARVQRTLQRKSSRQFENKTQTNETITESVPDSQLHTDRKRTDSKPIQPTRAYVTGQRELRTTSHLSSAISTPISEQSNSATERLREKDKETENEYVLIEKRTVEVNAFADAMARSPRMGNNFRKYSSITPRPALSHSNSGSSAHSPNNATVQALATAERRLGSSPTSALARALNIASQRLFGGGSPPSWLEHMVNNAVNVSSSTRSPGSKSDYTGMWLTEREVLSSEEHALISTIEGFTNKSNVVYDFGELKLRQLIPPPPSHYDDETENLLTNEAIVSLCEEAVVLYLKTLQLLQRNIDAVQNWTAKGAYEGNSVKLNQIVQWTRDRYNEVLEKAEYLQYKKSTALALVSSDYPFEEVTAEKLLYDRALELGRGAAVQEAVGEDMSQCEGDYEASVLMLEAILELGLSSTLSSAPAVASVVDERIEDEDRQVLERWIRLTRARLYKLREKIERSSAPSPSA